MLYYGHTSDTSFLNNGKQEFTERATAFFNALEKATPGNKNDPFGDLKPDIYEEELNEIMVYTCIG